MGDIYRERLSANPIGPGAREAALQEAIDEVMADDTLSFGEIHEKLIELRDIAREKHLRGTFIETLDAYIDKGDKENDGKDI